MSGTTPSTPRPAPVDLSPVTRSAAMEILSPEVGFAPIASGVTIAGGGQVWTMPEGVDPLDELAGATVRMRDIGDTSLHEASRRLISFEQRTGIRRPRRITLGRVEEFGGAWEHRGAYVMHRSDHGPGRPVVLHVLEHRPEFRGLRPTVMFEYGVDEPGDERSAGGDTLLRPVERIPVRDHLVRRTFEVRDGWPMS